MPYFLCHLATEDGHRLSQSFLASSVEECRRHFEREGFCILSIRKDWKKASLPALPFEKRVKDKDFIMFNQELVALLRAGYPILKSLELITSRTKNIHLQELLRKVETDVRSGKALSESFASLEKEFGKVYIAALMAGEQSGNLPGTIGRYLDYAKVISQTRSKIRAALLYPTLLIVFALVLMLILVNFILPRFAGFYSDFGARLPRVTRLLIAAAGGLRQITPFLLAVLVILVLLLPRLKKNEKFHMLLERAKLKIPYANRIWVETAISLFSRTLSLLLEAGITLLHGLPIACQAVPNRYLRSGTRFLAEDIRSGEPLSESLNKTRFFTPLAIDMIRIGENSANLHGMLKEVADVYDQRIQAKIDAFVSLIEPIIIIAMGMIVALMLLAVYLPIFNIIQIQR
ncbi:MAG: type II secretion system F family protein [Candidatus Aminicenantes bacterium]|nr:type II secretion system F family protein [Candidatus Aminicenantes bacterium]